jgi:hypothetical protein
MTPQQRTMLVAAAAAILGFAVGALWQFTSARGYANELDRTTTELTFQQLEATLGAATIEAQRGSHEIGRQLASEFFGGLQNAISEAPVDRQQAFRDILARRDAMITALSRSDPQAGPMLAQIFVRYRLAMGETVGPDSGTIVVPEREDTAAGDGSP